MEAFDGAKTIHSARRETQRDTGIGQVLQRSRWIELAHRRPVFRALWTALCFSCGHKDHGKNHALPEDVKNWSNDFI